MRKVILSLVVFLFIADAAWAKSSCEPGAYMRNDRRRTTPSYEDDFAGVWNGDEPLQSLDGCADEDMFQVSVVVYDHVWIRFDPSPEAGPTCTKVWLFDAQVLIDDLGSVQGAYTVGIMRELPASWNSTAAKAAAFTSGYALSNITTRELIDAIEFFDSEYAGEWDMVTNNCAARVIDVLTYLNITVNDATFLDWIASRLVTPYVVELLRNSTNTIGLLYPDLTVEQILAKPDAELMNKLTYWSANETLAEYGKVLEIFRAKAAAPRAAVAPSLPLGSPRAAPTSAPSSSPVSSGSNQPVSNAPQATGKVSSASSVASSFAAVSLASAFLLFFL